MNINSWVTRIFCLFMSGLLSQLTQLIGIRLWPVSKNTLTVQPQKLYKWLFLLHTPVLPRTQKVLQASQQNSFPLPQWSPITQRQQHSSTSSTKKVYRGLSLKAKQCLVYKAHVGVSKLVKWGGASLCWLP